MEAKGTEASTAGSRPTSVNPIGSKMTNKRGGLQSAYSNAIFNIDLDKTSKERERILGRADSTPKPPYIISQQTQISDAGDYVNHEEQESKPSPRNKSIGSGFMHRKQLSRAKLAPNSSVKRIVIQNNQSIKMHTGTVVLEEEEPRPDRDNLLNSSYIKIGSLNNKGMINSKQLSQKVLTK